MNHRRAKMLVCIAALLAAIGEDVLPNNLKNEQSLSDLALQLRSRWTKSKELLK